MAIQNPYTCSIDELRAAMQAENAPPPEPQRPNILAEFQQQCPDYNPQLHFDALRDRALLHFLETGNLPTAKDLVDCHALNLYQQVYPTHTAADAPIDESEAWNVPMQEFENVMHGLPRKADETQPEYMAMNQLRDAALGIERTEADAAWTAPIEQLKAAMEVKSE